MAGRWRSCGDRSSPLSVDRAVYILRGEVDVPTVLIVEDERKLRELLRSYLERDGLTVLTASTGAEALSLAATGQPDLLVLDLGLPDIPGESVAQEIRAASAMPILMLTAKSGEEDRVHGLELGADDYVTKPFSPREMVLRVRAILRRLGDTGPRSGLCSYGGGSLLVDQDRRTVTVRGAAVELTPTEWRLLVAMSMSPGRVYSRLELVNRVRGYEFEGYERSIDSHIKNLRRKVEADPRHPQLVLTVLGVGYRLGVDADA